eukprot:11121505-Heterocapsa_arctica.AAC.1
MHGNERSRPEVLRCRARRATVPRVLQTLVACHASPSVVVQRPSDLAPGHAAERPQHISCVFTRPDRDHPAGDERPGGQGAGARLGADRHVQARHTVRRAEDLGGVVP